MGPFQFETYHNPYVQSITQLMQAPAQAQAQAATTIGEAQARAALQQGQAWSGAAQGIGNAVGGAIQQATDPRRQLEAMQVEQVKRLKNMNDAATGIAKQATRPDGTTNYEFLRNGLAQLSIAPEIQDRVLKSAESFDAHAIQAANNTKEGHADLGNMLFQSLNGMPKDAPPQAVDAVLAGVGGLAKAQKLASDDELQQIFGSVKTRDDAMHLALTFMGSSPSKRYAEELKPVVTPAGAAVTMPGQEPTIPAPKPMTEPEIALKAAGGNPVLAMGYLKPGAKQTVEEEWLARDKRLAVAQNGGQPLSDAQAKDVEAKSLAAYAVAKADPAMREAALAQKALAAAQVQMNLNMQPTKEQAAAVADDLVNHRLSPSQVVSLFSTRGKEGLAFKLAVSAEAKKQQPDFNFEEAQATYDLAKSTGFQNTVRAIDSTTESIPRLLANVNKLGRGNFRSWNELANAAGSQFNSTDLKRVKTDALLVGDEVARVLAGGGTGSATSDAKLKQATDLINTSDSVPAIGAAMDEIQALMGARRRALTRGTYLEGLSAPKPVTGNVDGVSYKVR